MKKIFFIAAPVSKRQHYFMFQISSLPYLKKMQIKE